ncbi:MAG: hypothetical protein SFX72_08115 [Isosphaeraceae bacterium]|nr:hypothetical protein [Isosphaeraceae bacterium]
MSRAPATDASPQRREEMKTEITETVMKRLDPAVGIRLSVD